MTLLEILSVETGIPIPTLERIISTAPKRYKVYQIPKRNGGMRTIAHPAKELKELQRTILDRFLEKVKLSTIAMAYVKGRGILQNANRHVGQPWLLKIDFENFFPSLTPRDWDRSVRFYDVLNLYSNDRSLFHNLLFWGEGGYVPKSLSIGAPTSPAVSNILCIKLDQWMIEKAAQLGVTVTRYADDITVSGASREQLEVFERRLRLTLANSKGLRLTTNENKRGLYGPGERKMVTGLILTPNGKVSIGRERKREISTLVHKFKIEALEVEKILKIKGLLGFAKSIEPNFFKAISEKYGNEYIKMIQKYESPLDDITEFDLIG